MKIFFQTYTLRNWVSRDRVKKSPYSLPLFSLSNARVSGNLSLVKLFIVSDAHTHTLLLWIFLYRDIHLSPIATINAHVRHPSVFSPSSLLATQMFVYQKQRASRQNSLPHFSLLFLFLRLSRVVLPFPSRASLSFSSVLSSSKPSV